MARFKLKICQFIINFYFKYRCKNYRFAFLLDEPYFIEIKFNSINELLKTRIILFNILSNISFYLNVFYDKSHSSANFLLVRYINKKTENHSLQNNSLFYVLEFLLLTVTNLTITLQRKAYFID